MDPKAKNKRPRIVAVVLTGMVMATLLLWPSARDPRFVGTWRISLTSIVYKLDADGTFTYENHGEATASTQWRVRNGTFYTLYNYKGWDAARAWIDRIRTGKAIGDQAYPVVKVTSDAIVLRDHGSAVLLRVPDGYVPPKPKPGPQVEEDRDPINRALEARLRAIWNDSRTNKGRRE